MEIDIRARRVEDLFVQRAVILMLSGGAILRIECPFELADQAAGWTTIVPESISTGHRLRVLLRGKEIEAASGDIHTGMLSINFLGGLALRVKADSAFEAWSTTWADGSMVVALPGGGLSSWSARQ